MWPKTADEILAKAVRKPERSANRDNYKQPDQAVPQGGPRAADRDRDQQRPRLWDRQAAGWKPARPAEVGAQANRRLLDVQRISHDPILGETAFASLTTPHEVAGQRVSALRFADQRVETLLQALVVFRLQPGPFRADDLRQLLAPLLGLRPNELRQGRLSYELRRLRLHGLIERVPKSHRYRVTELGFRTALFFSRTYSRLIRPGFAQLIDARPTTDLRRPLEQFELAIGRWVVDAKLAS